MEAATESAAETGANRNAEARTTHRGNSKAGATDRRSCHRRHWSYDRWAISETGANAGINARSPSSPPAMDEDRIVEVGIIVIRIRIKAVVDPVAWRDSIVATIVNRRVVHRQLGHVIVIVVAGLVWNRLLVLRRRLLVLRGWLLILRRWNLRSSIRETH